MTASQKSASQTKTETEVVAPDAPTAYTFPEGTLDMFLADAENPNVADPRYIAYRSLCADYESAETTGKRAGFRGKLRALAVDMFTGESGPEIDFIVWTPPSERVSVSRDPNMTEDTLVANLAKVAAKYVASKSVKEMRKSLDARIDALLRTATEEGYTSVVDPRKVKVETETETAPAS